MLVAIVAVLETCRTDRRGKSCLLPSLALNFAVIYSSPGNLALFLFADARGQPDRLRGSGDQDQCIPIQLQYMSSYFVYFYIAYPFLQSMFGVTLDTLQDTFGVSGNCRLRVLSRHSLALGRSGPQS